MPTYTYRCKKCDHEFDQFQKINDPLLTQCPSCGEEALVRLIGGGAGLVFKGSGFYKTDYGKSASGGSSSTTGKPAGKSTKKETKTDSKPDSSDSSKSDPGGESKGEKKSETKKESPSPKKSQDK